MQAIKQRKIKTGEKKRTETGRIFPANVAAGLGGGGGGANVQHTKPPEEAKLPTQLFLTVNSRARAYARRNSGCNVHLSRICHTKVNIVSSDRRQIRAKSTPGDVFVIFHTSSMEGGVDWSPKVRETGQVEPVDSQ